MTQCVYLHIGLPKTGTTYLQRSLWRSHRALADEGMLLPGPNRRSHRLAVWDLMGRRLRGVRQLEVPGSWQRLVDAATAWPGEKVLVSEEFLVHARPAEVRRIAKAFDPAELHVVVTVRDLARVIGSMWQQEIVKGRTWLLPEFIDAVRDPEKGPATAGVAFWLRYDLKRILGHWQEAVPAERMHVVLVPPPGSPPELLLDRFASAVGVPPDRLSPARPDTNASMGLVETELLRQVNERLENALNERQYRHTVDKVIRPALLRRGAPRARIQLPPEELDWVRDCTDDLVAYLTASGHHLVGDLADLRPGVDGPPTSGVSTVTEADLLDASLSVLARSLKRHARLWWRVRRRAARVQADPVARLSSARRAAGYRVRAGALERADSNRLLAFAVHRYFRRTARDRSR